jgi:putative chitinase
MLVTAEILQSIAPDLDDDKAQELAAALNPASEWASITTPERQAAFLAQCAHESMGFSRLTENLNYSAHGLLKTFSRYFTPEEAEDYAHQPERIANRVYAGRYGNGDEDSGDGWRYRGRGIIQLTFLDNYLAAGEKLDLDLVNNPDQAAEPWAAAYTAAWYWNSRGLNRYADAGDFITITRRINGGLNGLEDRQMYWARAQEALSQA